MICLAGEAFLDGSAFSDIAVCRHHSTDRWVPSRLRSVSSPARVPQPQPQPQFGAVFVARISEHLVEGPDSLSVVTGM